MAGRAARDRAWTPPGTSLVRCDAFLRCRFARLPSFSKPFWALWSELEAVAGVRGAEMEAQGCRAHGLQAVEQRVSVIAPSGVLGEPSRPQAARPLSWSSSRQLRLRLHLVGAEEEDRCWTSLARQQCRRGFGPDFAGWSSDLRRYFAYAARRFPRKARHSAGSSPARCAAGRYCSGPVATVVQALGPCQTSVGQTAAGQPGVRGNGCVPLGSRAQAEWAPRRVSGAPSIMTAEAALPLRPSGPVFGSV